MAKRSTPEPFRHRGGWRAQVTLANGRRPAKDFATKAEAADWIVDQLNARNCAFEPSLGGPTVATVADALRRYAELYSLTKGGGDAELNRINHYLAGAGKACLRRTKDAHGKYALQEYQPTQQPRGWQDYNDQRRTQRERTYALIHKLGRTQCSRVSTPDIRELMTTMKADGLSDSTIQKEVALLKHLFNMAATEWNWKGFENPCQGLKLGKSQSRFVFLTKEQESALWKAVSECDNPYFWPLVVCALESTQRKDRLLNMRWESTDLDGRVMHGWSKGKMTTTPLSQHLVNVLSAMPRTESGPVFPMSANAVQMAWEGVREKVGLKTLQFRDLRHLGATAYARRGFSAQQLMKLLGHTSTRMAEIYVNLVHDDILKAMDATAPEVPVVQVPPPATGDASSILNERRAARVVRAVKEKFLRVSAAPEEAATSTPTADRAEPRKASTQDPPRSPAHAPPAAPAAAPAAAVCDEPVIQRCVGGSVSEAPAPAPTTGRVIAVTFGRRAT